MTRSYAPLLALAFVALFGCSREEPIRVYTVPKTQETTYTILGGIFPAEEPNWFFKLTGPTDELAPHAAELDKFLASVRFPNGPDKMPAWELPAGWKTGGANPAKMAEETILFGPDDRFVITLSNAKGGLEANLARWVGQVGLTMQPGETGKYAKPLGSPKPVGWRVEIVGPNNPAKRKMPGRM
jgi:hypothetical protein